MLGQLARKTLGCLLGQIAFHFSVRLCVPFSFICELCACSASVSCLCVYVCVCVHIIAYVCLDVFSICLCVCLCFWVFVWVLVTIKGLFCSMLWTFFFNQSLITRPTLPFLFPFLSSPSLLPFNRLNERDGRRPVYPIPFSLSPM